MVLRKWRVVQNQHRSLDGQNVNGTSFSCLGLDDHAFLRFYCSTWICIQSVLDTRLNHSLRHDTGYHWSNWYSRKFHQIHRPADHSADVGNGDILLAWLSHRSLWSSLGSGGNVRNLLDMCLSVTWLKAKLYMQNIFNVLYFLHSDGENSDTAAAILSC